MDKNHRRKNRPPVDRRYPSDQYRNGYARQDGRGRYSDGEPVERADHHTRVGRTGYLDKSMHGWGDRGAISGVHVGAGIGNDFTNGHRGMAKAVKGAKKFVRTRVRFHENAATKRLAQARDDAD